MNKAETAEYLVNLHSLLQAQEATGVTQKSRVLIDEYNKHWTKLKEFIQKDNEDETRSSTAQRNGVYESRTDVPGGISWRSEPDRQPRLDGHSAGADDNGSGPKGTDGR